MPTKITQIDDTDSGVTVLRIDGELLREDAELLRRIALDVSSCSGNNIVIDLADLDFLDSESAPVLKRMENELGFEIVGTEIFLQSVINKAEGR